MSPTSSNIITCIILHSEGQTSKWRINKKNTFLSREGLNYYLFIYLNWLILFLLPKTQYPISTSFENVQTLLRPINLNVPSITMHPNLGALCLCYMLFFSSLHTIKNPYLKMTDHTTKTTIQYGNLQVMLVYLFTLKLINVQYSCFVIVV